MKARMSASAWLSPVRGIDELELGGVLKKESTLVDPTEEEGYFSIPLSPLFFQRGGLHSPGTL